MAYGHDEGMYEGFKQAVDALFAPAHQKDRSAQLKAEQSYQALLTEENYVEVRKALDAQSDNFLMSRTMAQFHLSMAPRTFLRHLENTNVLHPFVPTQRSKAEKGKVMEWHTNLLRDKHGWKGKAIKSGRDTKGRIYLVDPVSGYILADAKLSTIPRDDALLAMSQGADFTKMDMAVALAKPWNDLKERLIWANAYEKLRRFEAESE